MLALEQETGKIVTRGKTPCLKTVRKSQQARIAEADTTAIQSHLGSTGVAHHMGGWSCGIEVRERLESSLVVSCLIKVRGNIDSDGRRIS